MKLLPDRMMIYTRNHIERTIYKTRPDFVVRNVFDNCLKRIDGVTYHINISIIFDC